MEDYDYHNPNVYIHKSVFKALGVIVYPNIIVHEGAKLGANAQIGYFEGEPPDSLTELGKNTNVRSGAILYHDVILGENSSVGHNSVIRDGVVVGKNTYIGALVMMEGETVVGDFVGLNAQCHITRHSEIGDYTFFGPNVVSMNDNKITYKREGHGKNMLGFTTERNVRIAGGVLLLPGVVLKEGSFIGAGSLVTKDVKPYAVMLGRPAREVVKEKLNVFENPRG